MRSKNIKKRKNIIFIIVTITILISIYLYQSNREYKYICLNRELLKEENIYEFMLEICTTKEIIPKGLITKKEEIISSETGKYYQLTKDSYSKEEMLYKEDFVLVDTNIQTETEIPLLNELEVITTARIENGLPIGNLEIPIKYKIYLKDKKIYAKNLNNNEEKIIFDNEEVKNIAVRPYCCTGNGKLIILTTKGNLYISKYDCNYFFSFEFPFEKLNITDLKSIKLVPKDKNDIVKSLYGINSKDEEIFIEEPEW